jgi:hypothetical protein
MASEDFGPGDVSALEHQPADTSQMSNALSIAALAVSIATAAYAGYVSWRISNREVTNTAITDHYASMRELSKLQLHEWRLAHIFEVEANYSRVVEALRDVAPQPDSIEYVMLGIKERAAALTLFGLYEHIVYQLDEVAADGDSVRSRFVLGSAAYFTDRLLLNPRLRYLWSEHGGNLQCEFETNVREHYREHVSPSDAWDEQGPYGGP